MDIFFWSSVHRLFLVDQVPFRNELFWRLELYFILFHKSKATCGNVAGRDGSKFFDTNIAIIIRIEILLQTV